jgi:uncharacterized protein (UPF0264 family)
VTKFFSGNPGLLVSVRTADEAETALRAGAHVIDVKDPSQGSLGRASDAAVRAVLRAVAGRAPVSAALGELAADHDYCNVKGLAYVKWGLSGCGKDDNWRRRLARAVKERKASDPACEVVPVAYADWQRAQAPTPETVAQFVRDEGCAAFLIDTFQKDGTTLLDWLTREQLEALRDAAGASLALAGSLGGGEISSLRSLAPTWFAVRGAVCRERRRDAAIDEQLIRDLLALLNSPEGPKNPEK